MMALSIGGAFAPPQGEASAPVDRPGDAVGSPVDLAATRSGSASPRGNPRVVAVVGGEVIMLADLTDLVAARVADLGPDPAPTRAEVIATAAAALEALIVRSLLAQEARERLPGPEPARALEARTERAWADRELSELIRREGVADEGELRAKLARRRVALAALRAEFVARSIAADLSARDRPDLGYEAYLDELRRRRPVISVATSTDLKRAGRRPRPFGPAATNPGGPP